MKKDIKFGILFYIAVAIVILTSSLLLVFINQEELIDAACIEIKNNNNADAIELIDKIFVIDMVGSNGDNALMTACKSGNLEILQYAVSKGARINRFTNGKLTPLELFCDSGYEAGGMEMLKYLLSVGCRQSTFSTKPAIFYLADNYYWMNDDQKELATEETLLLLQYGAPLGYNNTSILHLAAKSDMSDLFYTVVHTRAGLNLMTMKDGNGDTPWQVAVKNGSVGVQKVIRDLERECQQVEEEKRQEELLKEQESNDSYDEYESDSSSENLTDHYDTSNYYDGDF